MLGKLSLAIVLLFIAASGTAQQCNERKYQKAKKDGKLAPCISEAGSNLPCGQRKVKYLPDAKCCERVEKYANNSCWVIFPERQADLSRSIGGVTPELRDFIGSTYVPTPAKNQDVRKFVDRISKETNVDPKKIGGGNQARKLKAGARNLLSSPFGLGPFLGGSLFPECPVHVKLCHRVQCGGFYANENPRRCLSDPRCCYDYKLAFLRSAFGPGYMGDAPSCYYGATSKQWIYITEFFQPWNSWYTSFILDAFEDLFNTNAFNFAGKFLCELDIGRKAYPVGSESELQCNLVSGCWDESLPSGSQCLMASELIQQLFGQTTVYPSLFTNDPADTQCSNNWFEFGPRAYKRLACGVGPAPPNLFEMIYKWCPITDCCLNYLALSTDQRRDLSLFSSFGGGGLFGGGSNFNPLSSLALGGLSGLGGTTPFDPTLLAYLTLGGNSFGDDLSDLFCPYRALVFSSIFPDMSDVTEGCCDIPKCYHKKKLVGGARPFPPVGPPQVGPPQVGPPHVGPPPVGPPQPTYRWGNYGPCSAACGQGIQTRQCLFGNQQVAPQSCPGSSSRPCQGPPCIEQYIWGEYGPCSATCGQGTRTRRCYSRGTMVNSNFCGGSSFENCQQLPPCQAPARWGQFGPPGPCPVTCGGGTVTSRRPCLIGGREVSANLCPGGFPAATRTDSCNAGPCRPRYRWTDHVALRPCTASCGQGYQLYGRRCQDDRGQYVRDSMCPGNPGYENRPCTNQPCQPSAAWGPWTPVSPCGVSCGPNGLQHVEKQCRFPDGRPASPTLCPPIEKTSEVQRCDMPPCGRDPYYYAGWRASGSGCVRSPTGRCERAETRYCYTQRDNSYYLVDPQTECYLPLSRSVPCNRC